MTVLGPPISVARCDLAKDGTWEPVTSPDPSTKGTPLPPCHYQTAFRLFKCINLTEQVRENPLATQKGSLGFSAREPTLGLSIP